MNIIPFIDIMLVLLTIVLSISTFLHQEKMHIDLPQASESQKILPHALHEIIIQTDNTLLFENAPTSLEELTQKLTNLNSEEAIVLKADKQSDFGVFIAIVDLLKSQHKTNIDILVRKN